MAIAAVQSVFPKDVARMQRAAATRRILCRGAAAGCDAGLSGNDRVSGLQRDTCALIFRLLESRHGPRGRTTRFPPPWTVIERFDFAHRWPIERSRNLGLTLSR